MFTNGEVGGSFKDNEIRIKKFGQEEEELINIYSNNLSYNEGNINLIKNFIKLVSEDNINQDRNNIKEAIESHVMAFAAEYSRVSEEVVYIDKFFENAIKITNEIESTLF